jgi:hypothetical protein
MATKNDALISIPPDFPADNYKSALSGAQLKLAMFEIDGKYYQEGCTPDELYDRYLMCEDLVSQGHGYCQRKIKKEKLLIRRQRCFVSILVCSQ